MCSCSRGAARTGRCTPASVACARIGGKVAHAHLRWLSPFPANLGDVLRSYDRVLVPEMNSGQLLQLVRARYLVDARRLQPRHRQAVQGRRDRGRDPDCGGGEWRLSRS